MITLHARVFLLVIIPKRSRDMVQVPLAEQEELEQSLVTLWTVQIARSGRSISAKRPGKTFVLTSLAFRMAANSWVTVVSRSCASPTGQWRLLFMLRLIQAVGVVSNEHSGCRSSRRHHLFRHVTNCQKRWIGRVSIA